MTKRTRTLPRVPTPGAPARPTPEALSAARGGKVPDLIAPGLRVLFCGINPSLYSAAVRHHFARPGNRFWPTLHRAGFSQRLLRPEEEQELLQSGVGITNVVARATAAADELTEEEYAAGSRILRRKLKLYRPRVIAFLGLGAYRLAAKHPQATVGRQAQAFADVETWALPNPSGLNAHYQLDALVECYAALARATPPR
jgi:TDG/mug DNA glycosylase family protein